MTINIYDTANQLERDLRQQAAYLKLKEAIEAIQADEEARAIFQEFRQVSADLQTKQMQEEEITDEDMQALQELSGKVNSNPLITQMMQVEQEVSLMIDDLNKIITRPLNELYANLD